MIRNGDDIDETRVARIASVSIAVFAMVATLLVGSGFNVTVLVSMAFVFAASANFPALLLALTWRRFHRGRAHRRRLRRDRVGRDDRAEPAGVAGPDSEGSPSSPTFPGLVTISIGPRLLVGMMLSSAREEKRTYDELLVRSEFVSAPRA